MKKKRGMALLLLVLLLAATSLGLSQTTGNGGTGNTGSGSGASSNSGANAVINNNESAGHAGFISAVAGTIGSPGPIPGFAPEDGVCYIYWPAVERVLTMDAIRSMAAGAKFKKGPDFNWVTLYPNLVPVNETPIELVNYNPKSNNTWVGDVGVASVNIIGKYGYTDEQALGVALLKAKEISHTKRVAIIGCSGTETDTKASSIGIGGSGAYTPPSGTSAGALSLGFSRGSSRTKREGHLVLHVLAMNDWPSNEVFPNGVPHTAPPAPEPPKPEAPTPPQTPAQPQPPPAQQAPPAQTSKIEVIATPSPQSPVPPSAPTAPTPAPTSASTALDKCLRDPIPGVNVYFAFDHPKPDEGDVFSPTVMTEDGLKDNAAAIRTMEQWLENHPTRKIDVVGYASHQASNAYNWDLSGRRAKAVLDALKKDEKIRGQAFEADSNGKESANPAGSKEYNWQDRRVSFRIRGSDSSER